MEVETNHLIQYSKISYLICQSHRVMSQYVLTDLKEIASSDDTELNLEWLHSDDVFIY